MGSFNINVTAIGGHGCDRETKEGNILIPCSRMDCPDCEAARFCAFLSQKYPHGDVVMKFTHWPGEPNEVVDQYTAKHGHVTERKRIKGSF